MCTSAMEINAKNKRKSCQKWVNPGTACRRVQLLDQLLFRFGGDTIFFLFQARLCARRARRSVQGKCCACRISTSTRSASNARCAAVRWRRAGSSPRTMRTTAPPITSGTSGRSALLAKITWKERCEFFLRARRFSVCVILAEARDR